MKRKIKKGELYVINQPKHLLLSIVLMDCENYPLRKEIHDNLCKLSEISDIIFIFSDKYFDNSEIHKDKLTSLYQGCAFIDSLDNLPRTIFKALLYDKEIFSKHIGVTISRCQDLFSIKEDKLFNNIIKVNQSRISKPIFNIYRLSSDEIYKFYSTKEDIVTKYSRFNNSELLRKVFILSSICDIEGNNEVDCRYCTWGSKSRVLYFRNITINLFLGHLLSKEDEFHSYIDTFTDKDIRYLFAGLVKKFGIECLNYNIEDLEIDKI